MKIITLINPTDIEGVEEYRELLWVPSLSENRELAVWREANGSYAYDYAAGQQHETGFSTGQEAYNAGIRTARRLHPDAVEA